MADDIGDGVEWLQWLLTNDIEAVGGHRPSDMVSVVRGAASGDFLTTDRFTIRIRRNTSSATDSLCRFPISTYGAYVELPQFLSQSIFNIFSF
jgi:hypothetical protein